MNDIYWQEKDDVVIFYQTRNNQSCWRVNCERAEVKNVRGVISCLWFAKRRRRFSEKEDMRSK